METPRKSLPLCGGGYAKEEAGLMEDLIEGREQNRCTPS